MKVGQTFERVYAARARMHAHTHALKVFALHLPDLYVGLHVCIEIFFRLSFCQLLPLPKLFKHSKTEEGKRYESDPVLGREISNNYYILTHKKIC